MPLRLLQLAAITPGCPRGLPRPPAFSLRRLGLALWLAASCAHPAQKAAVPGLARETLARVTVRIAPETVVNDPVLADRGAELRTALARALADEGFRLADEPGALSVVTSIDYVPWTAVSASSLYIVVALRNEGVSVDQVEVQKVNEAFPDKDQLPDFARAVAHTLATSPRLAEFLTPAKR